VKMREEEEGRELSFIQMAKTIHQSPPSLKANKDKHKNPTNIQNHLYN